MLILYFSHEQNTPGNLKGIWFSIAFFFPHAVALFTHQELSHAALETYQTIGRLRSARLIGKSLAEFYMWGNMSEVWISSAHMSFIVTTHINHCYWFLTNSCLDNMCNTNNNFSSRRKGDPERAEPFLKEALKSYVSEGWSLPLTHTRKQVAECQKLLSRTDEYPSQWRPWIHLSSQSILKF